MLVEGTRPENVAGLAANPPHTLQIHRTLYKSAAHFTNFTLILLCSLQFKVPVLYSLQFLFFTHTLQIQSVLYGLISFTVIVSTLSTNTLLIQGTFPILSFICTVLFYILQSMIFCQPFCIT